MGRYTDVFDPVEGQVVRRLCRLPLLLLTCPKPGCAFRMAATSTAAIDAALWDHYTTVHLPEEEDLTHG